VIAILVPVLGRPQNAQPLVDSIKQATTVPHRILFLCTPFDVDEINAVHETGADIHNVRWEAGPGDWAKKINQGYRLTEEPFILLAADDLRFHTGWDTEVLRVAEETGAGVIGTNDLGNATVMRGLHSTHPVVRRSYVDEYGTIDEPGKVLHEGYRHQWVDTELIATAQMRHQWAFAKGSHVEHMHPFWKKGKMDATYEKALSTPTEDFAHFNQRKHLWSRAAMKARSA
jgi:hypothetical protein